jgi:hypothetical protein
MAEQTQPTEQTQPIIPPSVLLGIAGVALLIALGVLGIQGAFGVVGWAALATSVLALVLLVLLAPQQVMDALTGRTLRFGGTSVLVTVLFIAVLITVYWFTATMNWTADLSQTDQYSLNEQNAEALQQLAVDPNAPPVEIIGFFDSTQPDQRERIEILLQEYERASDNKITYRFINPDRQPLEAQRYSATSGSLVVRNTQNDDPEAAEVVNTAFNFEQTTLTNAILGVSAAGEFQAFFLNVEDGASIDAQGGEGLSELSNILIDRFNWNVQQVSILDFTSEESELELNSAAVDGEVLVIVGGSQELSELETDFLTEYLDNGGSLVMYASPDVDAPALASTGVLNEYLAENFGLSYDSNIVLDPQQSIQSLDTIYATSFGGSNFITQNIPPNSLVIAPFARSIDVADAAPENVQTYDLVQTGGSSYAKTVEELRNENVQQEDDDPEGPLTIAAAAENTNTGARVVLFGSATIPVNQFSLVQEAANLQISFNSLVWATGFDEFIQELPRVANLEANPADVPVTADTQQLNLINMISLFVLPFGMLAIGGVVWFTRRR